MDLETVGVAAAVLLASRFGEAVASSAGTSAWDAVKRLHERIARKFVGNAASERALAKVEAEPDDAEGRRVLAEHITASVTKDPRFRAEVQDLLKLARRDPALQALFAQATRGVNPVSITVGDNRAPITLNAPPVRRLRDGIVVILAAVVTGLAVLLGIVIKSEVSGASIPPATSEISPTSLTTVSTTLTTPSATTVTVTLPRVTPAAAPRDLDVVYAAGRVTLNWIMTDLAGGQLVHYLVSGTGLPDQAVTATTATYTGVPAGATITFTVRAITRTEANEMLTGVPAAKSINTPALQAITIGRGSDSGAACQKPDCTWESGSPAACRLPGCAWISATLTGFQPNSTYVVNMVTGGFSSGESCRATTNENGWAICNISPFNLSPGMTVHVYVDTPSGRIRSNILEW